jgi:hypothetical protein
MKKYQGIITRLGNGTIGKNGITTYSIIEIGDTLLQKVKIPTSLDSFLTAGSTATLHMRGSLLLGVDLANGKSYCYKAKPLVGGLLALVGIPLIPFFGFGLLFMWQGVSEILNYLAVNELQSQGAVSVSI